MLAEFFNGKGIIRIICGICLAVTLFCMGYARILSRVQSIELGESFYFLVSDDTRVEAGSEFVKWDGGAGYLLEHEGAYYVALTVFMDKESGETVQNRLTAKGEKTLLIKKGVQTLYFKGKEKKKALLYTSALNLFKSYISLLNECMARIENGMTQEACKRILNALARQFCYSAKDYRDYTAFSKLCMQTGKELEKICQETVYLKDLRFILCWQTEKYVELCDAFSI